MDLTQCRQQIDEIDHELLRLFSERMNVVKQVANYKQQHQLPIFHPGREQEIIADKMKQAPEEIKEYVKSFFVNLMETSKCYQLGVIDQKRSVEFVEGTVQGTAQTKVLCQGSLGAYQHIAAKQLFPASEILFCKSFGDVFEQVQNGQADYGLVPLENSTGGTVSDVYDLLSQYDLPINLMYKLKIEHCLAAKQKLALEDITDVYSHYQSFRQCSELFKQYPAMETHEYPNNAFAAKLVAESEGNIAAICSEECARLHHLEILKTNVQNSADNYTRFIVLSKTMLTNDDCNEMSICVRIPNQAGELNKLLTKFSLYSINMTKIESRPIGDKDFSVLFYISFQGNSKERKVLELIHDLQYNYDFFKLLGTYPAI